jgi:hypothetical protein
MKNKLYQLKEVSNFSNGFKNLSLCKKFINKYYYLVIKKKAYKINVLAREFNET